MPRVTYRQPNGAAVTIDVPIGASVMDGAVDNGIPGIHAQCGGACICATCHCYVEQQWLAQLELPDRTEREMLDYVWEPRVNSRLACQIRISEALDGLVVEVPDRYR